MEGTNNDSKTPNAHTHTSTSSASQNPNSGGTTRHPPQPSSTPSGAHQIRSRITVVCGECKRLKLKCDRKTPCGSCTKRDTLDRCVYSAAAAEKVDIHSMNNRLILVEQALWRAARGLPFNYEPTYPPVLADEGPPGGPGPSGGSGPSGSGSGNGGNGGNDDAGAGGGYSRSGGGTEDTTTQSGAVGGGGGSDLGYSMVSQGSTISYPHPSSSFSHSHPNSNSHNHHHHHHPSAAPRLDADTAWQPMLGDMTRLAGEFVDRVGSLGEWMCEGEERCYEGCCERDEEGEGEGSDQAVFDGESGESERDMEKRRGVKLEPVDGSYPHAQCQSRLYAHGQSGMRTRDQTAICIDEDDHHHYHSSNPNFNPNNLNLDLGDNSNDEDTLALPPAPAPHDHDRRPTRIDPTTGGRSWDEDAVMLSTSTVNGGVAAGRSEGKGKGRDKQKEKEKSGPSGSMTTSTSTNQTRVRARSRSDVHSQPLPNPPHPRSQRQHQHQGEGQGQYRHERQQQERHEHEQRQRQQQQQQQQQRYTAQLLLPPLSIYYPLAKVSAPGLSEESARSFPAVPPPPPVPSPYASNGGAATAGYMGPGPSSFGGASMSNADKDAEEDPTASFASTSYPLYFGNTPGPMYRHAPRLYNAGGRLSSSNEPPLPHPRSSVQLRLPNARVPSSSSSSMSPPALSPPTPALSMPISMSISTPTSTTPRPTLTPALLSLLPSPEVCAWYLECARGVVGVRGGDLGGSGDWEVFVRRCGVVYGKSVGGKGREREVGRYSDKEKVKEKEKERVRPRDKERERRPASKKATAIPDGMDMDRMRAIYFAGAAPGSRRPGLPIPTSTSRARLVPRARVPLADLDLDLEGSERGGAEDRPGLAAAAPSSSPSSSTRPTPTPTPTLTSAMGTAAGGASASAYRPPLKEEEKKEEEVEEDSKDKFDSELESIPFFALMCAVLAVGGLAASSSPSSRQSSIKPESLLGEDVKHPPLLGADRKPMLQTSRGDCKTTNGRETPAFLYALSQQALGAWLDDENGRGIRGVDGVRAGGGDVASAASASAVDDEYGDEERGWRREEEREREERERVWDERTDYLRACLVGVGYLMGGGVQRGVGGVAEKGTGADGQGVLGLVGKMVNATRTWGYGASLELSSPSSLLYKRKKINVKPSSSGKRKEKEGPSSRRGGEDNGKRRVTVTVDVDIDGDAEDNDTRPRSKQILSQKRCEKEERVEARRRVLWDVLFYDLFTSDIFGQPPLAPATYYSLALPSLQLSQPRRDGEQDRSGCDRGYLALRASLTQLVFSIKQRISTPECCCGYTLDQAARLESEVKRWVEDVPRSLRWAFNSPVVTSSSTSLAVSLNRMFGGESSSESEGEHENGDDEDMCMGGVIEEEVENVDAAMEVEEKIVKDEQMMKIRVKAETKKNGKMMRKRVQRVQSCEMALVVQMVTVNIYSPFLAGDLSSLVSSGCSSSTNVCLPALQNVLAASQAIIRISRMAKGLLDVSIPGPFMVRPVLLDLYPLEQLVFNATVVCAHEGLGPLSSTARVRAGTEMMQSVGLGLDMLESFHGLGGRKTKKEPSPSLLGSDEGKIRAIEVLRKRWDMKGTRANTLKRKRSQVERDAIVAAAEAEAAGVRNGDIDSMDDDCMDLDGGFDHDKGGSAGGGSEKPDGSSSHVQTPQSHCSLPSFRSTDASSSNAANTSPTLSPERAKEVTSPPNPPRLIDAVTARAERKKKTSPSSKESRDRDKEKKAPSVPRVGVRVRLGKDGKPVQLKPLDNTSRSGTPSARSQLSTSRQPLLTSAPRVLTSEGTLGYANPAQAPPRVQANPAPLSSPFHSPMLPPEQHRSRSSSLSHVQQEPPPVQQYPNVAAMYARKYSLPGTPAPPPPSAPQHHDQSFDHPSATNVFAQPPQASSYDAASLSPAQERQSRVQHHHPYDQSQNFLDPDLFTPNAFTANATTSAGGSPYGSVGSGLNSHQSSPPTYGPQPPQNTSSTMGAGPESYFRGGDNNGGGYDSGCFDSLIGFMGQSAGATGPSSLYDVKAPMDGLQPHQGDTHHPHQQMQHLQHPPQQHPMAYSEQPMLGMMAMDEGSGWGVPQQQMHNTIDVANAQQQQQQQFWGSNW